MPDPAAHQPPVLAEVHRGAFLESVHRGHAAVCDASGAVLEGWGDPARAVLPRSSCKMVQALPLAREWPDLPAERLALACASHQGAPVHIEAVGRWLSDLGLSEPDLRCGPQPSRDRALRHDWVREGRVPDQLCNNCSGKHAGFLMLGQRLGGGAEYVDSDHPVQCAVLEAFEETTGETSPGHAVDGCSAPNFATSLRGLATAMARMAAEEGPHRRLREAMVAHPDLVAGEGRACTDLMRAMDGVAVKTGAEGVFVAILPARGLGVAVKVEDGATRAAECAIAALLVRLGALDAGHPAAARWMTPEIRNWRGIVTGGIRPGPALR